MLKDVVSSPLEPSFLFVKPIANSLVDEFSCLANTTGKGLRLNFWLTCVEL